MGGDLIDGAILALTGIGVVFAVLAILAQIARLLSRVFADKNQGPIPTTTGTETIVSQEDKAPAGGDVVAAIALALSLAESRTGRPVTKERGLRAGEPNPWAASGRQHIMDSRKRARKQW